MKSLFARAARRVASLAAAARLDSTGVAAVEFALILPLMLIMYIGSAEITQALIASRNATLTARALADLVSQQPNGVDVTDATLADAFTAASAIMAPFSPSALAMTITSVEFVPNASATTGYDAKPRWTAVQNGGAPRPCTILTPSDDSAAPTAKNLAKGVYAAGSIIIADVVFTYKPGFGGNFFTAVKLPTVLSYAHSVYMRPRQWTGTPDYIGFDGASAKICQNY